MSISDFDKSVSEGVGKREKGKEENKVQGTETTLSISEWRRDLRQELEEIRESRGGL